MLENYDDVIINGQSSQIGWLNRTTFYYHPYMFTWVLDMSFV